MSTTIKEIQESMKKALSEYEKESFDSWNELTYEQKCHAFYYVVKTIMKGEKEGNSYRGMIYDVFNFGMDMYMIGIQAGYMDLHNALYNHFELEKEK